MASMKAARDTGEKLKFTKDGKEGYEANRTNEEIAAENARVADVVRQGYPKAEKIADIPEGPMKQGIITNILNNNQGIVTNLAKKAVANSVAKNVDAKDRISFEDWKGGYNEQLTRIINNYKPKSGLEIGQWINQAKGLKVKFGTEIGRAHV